jgi:thiol-disulfide isomerase/thioredoxin
MANCRFSEMNNKIEFFYSKTCPHCPPVKKMVHEIVKDLGRTVEVCEIDAWSEEGEPLAEKYGIQLVPTIVVNGTKCAEGIISRQQLASALKAALS